MTSTLESIPLNRIDGSAASMGDYAGQVRLIVNVASKCGLTPQYDGLEALYQRYRDQGFVVLGFPSNDFRGQEPGSDAEIAAFCKLTYAVDFPMFAKQQVTGEGKGPLYAALIAEQPLAFSPAGDAMRERLQSNGIEPAPPPEVLWNFEKFLVARNGTVVARFGPDVAPDAAQLVAAIKAELGRS